MNVSLTETKKRLNWEKMVAKGFWALMREKVEEHRAITGLPLTDLEAMVLVLPLDRDTITGFGQLGKTLADAEAAKAAPVPMVLVCPDGHPHIDEGEWSTKPHKTHQCQVIVPWEFKGTSRICGLEWRPHEFNTVGVAKTQL